MIPKLLSFRKIYAWYFRAMQGIAFWHTSEAANNGNCFTSYVSRTALHPLSHFQPLWAKRPQGISFVRRPCPSDNIKRSCIRSCVLKRKNLLLERLMVSKRYKMDSTLSVCFEHLLVRNILCKHWWFETFLNCILCILLKYFSIFLLIATIAKCNRC